MCEAGDFSAALPIPAMQKTHGDLFFAKNNNKDKSHANLKNFNESFTTCNENAKKTFFQHHKSRSLFVRPKEMKLLFPLSHPVRNYTYARSIYNDNHEVQDDALEAFRLVKSWCSKQGIGDSEFDLKKLPLYVFRDAATLDRDTMKAFIELGLDPNITNHRLSLLHIVENPKVVEFLLAKGANPNAKNYGNRTPLYYAKDPKIVELLLAKGADPAIMDNDGSTPLHEAEDPKIVELLLAKGADVNALDNYGNTPLTNAVDLYKDDGFIGMPYPLPYPVKDPQVVKLLLEQGANYNIRCKYGKTLLHMATSNVDGCQRDLWETIPQHEENALKVVDLLLAKGVDPNATDQFGRTPLHYVDSPRMVELLLSKGANPLAHDKYGKTPLDYSDNPKVKLVLAAIGSSVGCIKPRNP